MKYSYERPMVCDSVFDFTGFLVWRRCSYHSCNKRYAAGTRRAMERRSASFLFFRSCFYLPMAWPHTFPAIRPGNTRSTFIVPRMPFRHRSMVVDGRSLRSGALGKRGGKRTCYFRSEPIQPLHVGVGSRSKRGWRIAIPAHDIGSSMITEHDGQQ
jgi:hypothetical protein